MAVTVVALTLSVSLAGCGGDGGEPHAQESPGSASAASSEGKGDGQQDGPGGNEVPDTSRTLATINGSNGFRFLIHSASRDDGGFLTVTGAIENTSGKGQSAPVQWNGQEAVVKATGRSLGGMTLVDKIEKKRYYVLRDTDGYPLTTTGISRVDPGEQISFFAQFPAPPASTPEVDLQIPLMPVATIELS
ncbi:hypothetical protein GCM10023329_21780 [Streptomyces sanyensis]|uniref:Secreted protein n=1 Tax=Streptomyces sanyensis TaxID=568869 RepID=A0ABP9A4J8_9ACTN